MTQQHGDTVKHTLTIRRTFNAPITLVWKAWARPEHIVKWWAPKEMDTKVMEHEFKTGGKWNYVMTMPDGSTFTANGVYLEIVEPGKITTSADFKPMTEGVELQVLLHENGDKTDFTFHVVHPTEAYCKQQEEMGFYNGWGAVFDRLEELLSAVGHD